MYTWGYVSVRPIERRSIRVRYVDSRFEPYLTLCLCVLSATSVCRPARPTLFRNTHLFFLVSNFDCPLWPCRILDNLTVKNSSRQRWNSSWVERNHSFDELEVEALWLKRHGCCQAFVVPVLRIVWMKFPVYDDIHPCTHSVNIPGCIASREAHHVELAWQVDSLVVLRQDARNIQLLVSRRNVLFHTNLDSYPLAGMGQVYKS